MKLEDRGVAKGRSPQHFNLDAFADAEIIEPSGDGFSAADGEYADELALRDLVEGRDLSHGFRRVALRWARGRVLRVAACFLGEAFVKYLF